MLKFTKNLSQYDRSRLLECEPVDGVLVVLSSNQINIATFVHQMGDVCFSNLSLYLSFFLSSWLILTMRKFLTGRSTFIRFTDRKDKIDLLLLGPPVISGLYSINESGHTDFSLQFVCLFYFFIS